MNDDLFARDFDYKPRRPPERDNLFVWTIFILLLIGLALACWLGSFYVFGHPEKPDSYKILQKLHKLDPPKRFELTQAPPGEFLTPQKAYERYSSMSRFDLERENGALLRDYINNFQATKRLVPYITGRYTIMSSYGLKATDFFGSGVVAIAQSVDFPQTVLEHVYTAAPQTIPVLEQMLAVGLDIKLEKTMDLSAIIHVTRMIDGRLQFTVVPLLYGTYALKQGSGSFSLDPPALLNPGGGLPIVRGQLLEDALKSYAVFTKKRTPSRIAAGGGTPAIPVAQPAAQTTIVRLDVSPSPTPAAATAASHASITPPRQVAVIASKPKPTPETTLDTIPPTPAPTPAAALAATEPENPPSAQYTPAPPPEATPPPPTVRPSNPFLTPPPETTQSAVAAASPVAPALTPPPSAVTAATSGTSTTVPEATPPLVAAASTPKIPLVPFLVSSPTPGIGLNTGASWKTYPPGQMPRGRLVSPADVNDLADRGTGGERLYLRGSFVVTASGESRAVLRPSGSAIANAFASVTKQSVTRIIVEFPAGMQPPAERSNVSRDENRPFEVRDVRRTTDGQINVFVREVTAP